MNGFISSAAAVVKENQEGGLSHQLSSVYNAALASLPRGIPSHSHGDNNGSLTGPTMAFFSL